MCSSSDYQKFINTYHFRYKSANTSGQTKTMRIVPGAKLQVSNLIPQKFWGL
ncbi:MULTISPECIES: hypothetical protein [unclassified Nostoc]|uniref:hypothetical protein n=1 Tax=unclassified Nostoc TaxID=2593658 RepID=UPI002AD8D889|nr:hypothetical protein [Nostoc sp. ChiQUE02]